MNRVLWGVSISKVKIPNYSLSEELINSISHGVASIFSIVGLIMLVIKAANKGAMAVTTVTLFGTTMIILYTISCIYHALSPKITGKKVMRVIDHCNVFLLVFGTIIPVALVGIEGYLGWIYFSIVALVTLIGIVFSAIDVDKNQKIEVICPLINGWSVTLFSKTLITNIGTVCFLFVVLGCWYIYK